MRQRHERLMFIDNFNDTFPYPSPAPAPGPSLLDDRESQFLESFFDGVSNDQPFDFNPFTYAPDGSDMGMRWDELPPTFMGTQTSFGQQPQGASMSHGFPGVSESLFNPNALNHRPPPPASSSAPARVLGSTSYLDNPNIRQLGLGTEGLFRGPNLSIPPTTGQARQPPSRAPYAPTRAGTGQPEPVFKDTFYTDMVFGGDANAFQPRRISQNNAKADLRWGSDAGFGVSDRFVPAPTQRKEIADVERHQIKALAEAFIETSDLHSSADSTRVSSPTLARTHQRTKSIGRNYENDDEDDSRSGKRRKSKYHDDGDADFPDSGTSRGSNKKRKGMQNAASPTESEANQKRRRSNAAAAAKATRENLTEDQKRENHIKSEQKRRTLIREGFEDLGELVPGLRGGGFSKSAVLIMTADWLEELMQGNDVLRRRLDQMR